MSGLLLPAVSAICLIVGVACFAVAVKTSDKTASQQVLLRVTRDANTTRIVDSKSKATERLIDPILNLMLRFGRSLTPRERLTHLEERLDRAGFPEGWDINRLLAVKALALLVGGAFGFMIGSLFWLPMTLVLTPIFAALFFYAPDYFLSKAAEKRKEQMQRTLADTVDMLNLTLAAGIGFDSALRLVAQNTTGALSEEFGRVVQEITIGKSRTEALRSLVDRTSDDDLRRFAQTCIQAERRGTPFGEILTIQARELRIKRRQLAEEKAQKVPVKILFPMMIFVLPCLMLVVMGPAIVKIATEYK